MRQSGRLGDGGIGVEVHSVEKAFRSPSGSLLRALDKVSVEIAGGEFVAVVGPSGCGKTTLLRLLMGLDSPTSGSIEFAVDPKTLRRSFVFQRSSLLPWRTVEDNVEFGLTLRSGRGLFPDRAARREHITRLLRLTGLEEFRSYYPAHLSGGMQQRVNLGRALAVQPNVLLMDEPFSALDAMTKERLQRELAGIVGQLSATVVFVTHDIREAVFLADRVIVMASHPGRVVEVVDIDAPAERSIDYQQSAQLAAQARNIWALLGEHATAGVSELSHENHAPLN